MGLKSDIRLIAAEGVSSEARAAVINASYADYYVPVQVTPAGLERFDQCYDSVLSHSVVAQSATGEPIGMALLARRGDRGWVSAVGVLPGWRKCGIAREMMTHLVGRASELGVHQIRLEVIIQNLRALSLYGSLGFRSARELLTWRRPAEADPLPPPSEPLLRTAPEKLLEHFDAFHDQPPCWQRAAPTLRKMIGRLLGHRLAKGRRMSAYCLTSGPTEPTEAVSLMDVGIGVEAESQDAGQLLLQALAACHPGRSISIMNVPADDSLSRILAGLGFHVTLRQSEMLLDL